jgi:hypothetical protein
MPLYRHGDLLIENADGVPKDARKLQHLVLAEGELTGHSHRIAERGAGVLYQSMREMYLDITTATATVVHQEHGPISLPRGVYRVWRQREYSPKDIRYVRD